MAALKKDSKQIAHSRILRTGLRGPFLTSTLGANFDPRGDTLTPMGEFCPLGVKLSPGDEILCSPLHSSK
jgi:hypothetical protein